jgi:hypothetical protein
MPISTDPIQVAGRTCSDEVDCPKVFVDLSARWQALVQGDHVTDATMLARSRPAAGEIVAAIPLGMLFRATLAAAWRVLLIKARLAR